MSTIEAENREGRTIEQLTNGAGAKRSSLGSIASKLVGFLVLAAIASPANAELAYFATGRSLSIKSHRIENGSLVLVLRAGGEMRCGPSAVVRIVPDEVPYPKDKPKTISQVRRPLDGLRRYADLIGAAAAANGVPASLVRAVIEVESAYRERAVSPKGAMGLMQLMPATARAYALNDPYDPRANIDAGTQHLRSLLERFSVPLALAAYNAGEAAVDRFGDIPPYPETRNYVARVLALAQISQH